MIYIIGGAPRTGKSIISNRLMGELSVPWISTDALATIVHDLTPIAERPKNFPFKGFESNDELSDLNINQMVQHQITETTSLTECIDSLVRHQIGVRDSQIIEGVHLSPEHVKRMLVDPKNSGQVKTIFLIPVNAIIQLESMRKNASHFDWLSGASDKTFEAVAAFVVAYGELIKKECDKFQLPYIERKGRFDEENTEIINRIKS